MIKNKKPFKLHFSRTLKTIGLFCLAASCFVGCKNTDPSTQAETPIVIPENNEPLYIQTYALPTQEQAMQRLLKIYGDESKMYLLCDKIMRFPCPVEQEKIQVNFEFKPTKTQKVIFEEAIDDYNEMFAIINPNYQFEINYTPTEKDLLNPYSIDVEKVAKIKNPSTALGQATIPSSEKSNEIDGLEIYDASIQIADKPLEDNLRLTHTFNHELGHVLGAGDAYKNPNATLNTMMQGYSPDNYAFTLANIDIAFFDALYRDPNNTKTEEEINDYITNHYTPTKTEIRDNINKKVFDITSLEEFNLIKQEKSNLISSLKNNSYGYKQELVDDLIEKLKTSNFNTEFGKSPVSFGELPREERDIFITYHFCRYRIPYSYGSSVYDDYFINSRTSENDYNVAQTFQTSLSICDDANGLVDDLSPYVYVNIEDYVLEIKIIDIKTPDLVPTGEKMIHLNGVYQITNKTPQEYFANMFSKTATTETELSK